MDAKLAVEEVTRRLQITLKDKQEEAVVAILERKDIFAILPTGYGGN